MRNASIGKRPVALVGCRVLQSVLEPCGLEEINTSFLEYGLHRTPALLRSALQRHLDGLAEPSVVLMAYGLCGNGVEGLQAGRHTLVFPRCHDCLAILMGSHEAYMREFTVTPGTYFLSKGWLECGSHPLKEYEDYVASHGPKMARWLIDQLYHNYTRVAFVGAEPQDFVDYGPRARQVAEFLGANYVELEGSDAFIRHLLDTPRTLDERDPEVVIVRPGGQVVQAAFFRETALDHPD